MWGEDILEPVKRVCTELGADFGDFVNCEPSPRGYISTPDDDFDLRNTAEPTF